MLLLCALFLPAQDSESRIETSDDEFVFEVYREHGKVMLALTIRHPETYKQLLLERSGENLRSYGQCRFILIEKNVDYSKPIIEQDRYPLPASTDAYYRIKSVTTDGIERVYPPVRLKALTK